MYEETPEADGYWFVDAIMRLTMQARLNDLREEMAEYDRRVHGDRTGEWFPLFSCSRFYPSDVRPGDIRVEDIAHALAGTNRFYGHTRQHITVAQHSVLVSENCSSPMLGLMHDAAEAVLGDVITPIKEYFRRQYEAIEEPVMLSIAAHLGFEDEFHSEAAWAAVKKTDRIVLATEIRDLTVAGCPNKPLGVAPLRERITPWTAEQAERVFLERFNELAKRRQMAF